MDNLHTCAKTGCLKTTLDDFCSDCIAAHYNRRNRRLRMEEQERYNLEQLAEEAERDEAEGKREREGEVVEKVKLQRTSAHNAGAVPVPGPMDALKAKLANMEKMMQEFKEALV